MMIGITIIMETTWNLTWNLMKVKKQYSVDAKIAIAIDVTAAKKQVTSSSIVEKAVCAYLDLDQKKIKQLA